MITPPAQEVLPSLSPGYICLIKVITLNPDCLGLLYVNPDCLGSKERSEGGNGAEAAATAAW